MVILTPLKYGRLLCLVGLLWVLQSQGQDLHFSHYRGISLLNNPAYSAAYQGDYQLSVIHRNQWQAIGEPFQTTAASFDKKFFILPGDFGIGLLVANDLSGNIGFTQTRAMLNTAYHHKMGRSKIGGGIQAGMGWKSYGLNGITYPSQYSREIGDFDPGLISGEIDPSDQLSYFDLSAGALFQTRQAWGDMLIGAAFMHLNAPNESFLDRTNRLPIRMAFETRAEVKLGRQFFLLPSAFIQSHNKAQEILPGMGAGVYFSENTMNARKAYLNLAVRDGFERNGDSFIITGALEFKQIATAISYDYNYSDLDQATGGRGAIEFSLIYSGLSSEPERIIVPCDRY